MISIWLLLCLLLVHPPAPNQHLFVQCQLEAVGAVLSVVPVTSILATAGLVGVKLAALSRLLDLLGYDRAYLAQGGKGTAAHPIGLQTNYAYMFPYVPGLNVSVSGQHRLGLPADAPHSSQSPAAGAPEAQRDASALGPAHRKTYPAMGLPGDYEAQQRPFRGSEALREIFRQAGLNVRLPSVRQSQQLQQQLNLPQQGNDHPNHPPQNRPNVPPSEWGWSTDFPPHGPPTSPSDPQVSGPSAHFAPPPPRHDLSTLDEPPAQQQQQHQQQQQQQQQRQPPPNHKPQIQPQPQPQLSAHQTNHNLAETRPTDHSIDQQQTNNNNNNPNNRQQPVAAPMGAAGHHHRLSHLSAPPIPSNLAPQPNGQPAGMHSSSSSPHQQQGPPPPPPAPAATPGRQQNSQQSPTSTQSNQLEQHNSAPMHQVNMAQPNAASSSPPPDSTSSSSSFPVHLASGPLLLSPSSNSLFPFHPVPQHEEFHRRLLQAQFQRDKQRADGQTLSPLELAPSTLSAAAATTPNSQLASMTLPTGQLAPALSSLLMPPVPVLPSDINAKNLFTDPSQPPDQRRPTTLGAVPLPLRPLWPQANPSPAPSFISPPGRPTRAAALSLSSGSSNPGEEFATTNFLPRPFDTDDWPTTMADDNELDRIQNSHGRRRRRRRRKRALPVTTGPSAHGSPAATSGHSAAQNFGMPAMNIHSVRRRRKRKRRSLALILLAASDNNYK